MSLDLEPRQRAMLQEMGVRVWLPEPEAEPQTEGLPIRQKPVAAVAQSVRPLAPPAPPLSAQIPPSAPVTAPVLTADAIETIAAHALSTGPAALKALNSRPPAKSAVLSASGTTSTGELVAGIAAMDWDVLADSVAQCRACPLCTDRRAPVFEGAANPAAPRRADWLIVGEPPDDAEERQGAPFAEAAGQLLDNMLKAVGVSRYALPDAAQPVEAAQSAYVTNVVKCRPSVVRNPTAPELALCENFLRREVALVQPKVILAMGRFAAQTLLHGSLPEGSKLPFGKLRGQIYRYQGIPVIVTYHPTVLLRSPQDKARAWADLCLALECLEDVELEIPRLLDLARPADLS